MVRVSQDLDRRQTEDSIDDSRLGLQGFLLFKSGQMIKVT